MELILQFRKMNRLLTKLYNDMKSRLGQLLLYLTSGSYMETSCQQTLGNTSILKPCYEIETEPTMGDSLSKIILNIYSYFLHSHLCTQGFSLELQQNLFLHLANIDIILEKLALVQFDEYNNSVPQWQIKYCVLWAYLA